MNAVLKDGRSIHIDLQEAIVTLLSVAPSCNFHNKPTTQDKSKIHPVSGATTILWLNAVQYKTYSKIFGAHRRTIFLLGIIFPDQDFRKVVTDMTNVNFLRCCVHKTVQ